MPADVRRDSLAHCRVAQVEAMSVHMAELTSDVAKARVELLDAHAEAAAAKQEAEGLRQQLGRAQMAPKQVHSRTPLLAPAPLHACGAANAAAC